LTVAGLKHHAKISQRVEKLGATGANVVVGGQQANTKQRQLLT
jgi:uncharacterized protein YllA (UPF0747 family)